MIQATGPHPDPPRRVLIIKPSALGDVVTAIPVLRGLKRTFTGARVSWLVNTNCAAIIRADRDLDELIPFDRRLLGRAWRSAPAAGALKDLLTTLRRRRFDWVLDLQGLLRSGLLAAATTAPMRAGFADAREAAPLFYTRRIRVAAAHTVDRNVELARRLGIDARPADMRIEVAPRGRSFAESFRRAHNLQPAGFLVCVPPTRWRTKRYPVRHWRTVVSAMSKQLPVVLVGAPGDEEPCGQVAEGMGSGVIDLSGKTRIEEMVAVIAASAGVVCSDSAAKFIAPAVGVDVVVLIGPTQVERTGPYLRGRAIVADVPCAGCLKKRCPHVTCMQIIHPSDVIKAAEEMIAERPG